MTPTKAIKTGTGIVAVVIAVIWIAIVELDKLGVIYRRGMDWPAFATITGSIATLLTGLAAVFAAYIIGLKQAGISERQTTIQERQATIMDRQTDILSRQAELQELTLNSELYDRRKAIYDATGKYLNDNLLYGHLPNDEVKEAFYQALSSSRFVFRDSVAEAMRQMLSWAVKHDRLNKRIERAEEEGELDKQDQLTEEVEVAFNRLSDFQGRLPIIFSELRLVIDPP